MNLTSVAATVVLLGLNFAGISPARELDREAKTTSTNPIPKQALAASISGDAEALSDPLARGFLHPPDSAKPLAFWHWMNGCVTKEGITADLEAMRRIGLGGPQTFAVQVEMVASDGAKVRGPIKFMSPEWRELVRHAVAECDRLGLDFCMLNCEGWGEAGGPSVTPAQSMQKVVWTESRVTGGKKVSLALAQPKSELGYYEDIALLALPTATGDGVSATPVITASVMKAGATGSAAAGAPMLVLPLPMPEVPQWVRLEFDREYKFSSLRISINRMRDVADPSNWESSSLTDAAAKKSLHSLQGPRRWELQVARDGQTFQTVAPVSTHGTTSFPETSGRIFRIWMPVPPPLQSALPLARTEKIEITEMTFAGPRIDRPEARTGQTIDAAVAKFSTATGCTPGDISGNPVLNLTGKTEWDAPPGNWTLLRIGHTSTGARIGPAIVGGLECDKLSAAALTSHFKNGMLGTVLSDSSRFLGAAFKNVHCDSWELGYENWTPLMREEFLRRRGYAMDHWLPALTGHVVGGEDASERFLWDFRRTIADLVAENYYGTLSDLLHQHNMGLCAEAAGHGLPGIVDQLQCKGRTDVPVGEFWVGRRDIADTKEAASAAHIYGKKIAGAESFTANPEFASWTRDPYSLKAEGDLQLCMGINRFSFHCFAHQPWSHRKPGMTLGHWGTNFDRMNTWWELARDWIISLSRCQFLLQQGTFVADACYFYGEDAPVGSRLDFVPRLPAGFDFDVCNTEMLKQMEAKDERAVLPSGMSYRVLVLPDRARMTPEVLSKVRSLVKAGITLVGPKPTLSPSLANFPDNDRAVQAMANEVWGDCDGKTITSHAYGQGWVKWGGSFAEVLGVPPDFQSDDPNLRFIHRREGRTEIYFVSNQREREVSAQCTFRVNGLAPELWYPDNGRRETVAMYSHRDGLTVVPLHFDPAGSVFVVFRQPASSDPIASVRPEPEIPAGNPAPVASPVVSANGQVAMTVWQSGKYVFTTAQGKTLTASTREIPQPLALTGPWQIQFPANLGAPPVATFERLESWTTSKDDGIKYFSGTATYHKEFSVPTTGLPPGAKLYLDLGEVRNLAQVTLNGEDLGVLWKPPFRVEITSAFKPGPNRLEIKVTNLWPNRMIGDQKLPAAKRITWSSYNPYRADSEPLVSGLLGPVTIRTARSLEVAPSNSGL